jgi:hypothetical protein
VDLTIPAQPSNTEATPYSDTEIQVTWTDNSGNEDDFRIDREQVVAGADSTANASANAFTEVGIVGPNVTTFLDSGLAPSTAYRYRVRACNQNGCSEPTAEPAEVSTFAKLVIETTSVPNGVVGDAYEQILVATGGDGTVTWSVSEGSLPDGITLSGTGTLSGTPTAEGTFDFTVQVVGAGQTVTQGLSLIVYALPTITTSSLPVGVFGIAYQVSLEASGGDGTYEWIVSAGAVPPGLTFDQGGTLTGTPTTKGTYDLTIEVTSIGKTASAAFTLPVYDPLVISTTSLANGLIGSAYSETLLATGGDGTYTWSLTSGSLPAGLALDSNTGTISGTPTTGETGSFTVQVASGGLTATADLSINLYAVLSVTTSSLPNATDGVSYSHSLAASGGDANYSWSITVGALPDGLSLTPSSGLISGTPTTIGTSSFTAQVVSGDAQTATAALSLEVVAQAPLLVRTTEVPDARSGVAYSQTLEASGGTGTGYAWSLEAGTLPSGVTLSTEGILSGTPSESGSFSFTPRVEDDGGTSATAVLGLHSCEAALSLGVGESLVTPFPARCGVVLPDADADYRIALMPRAQVLDDGDVPNLAGGLRLSAIAGTPGEEFFVPPQMAVMQVRPPLPEDEGLDPEILRMAKATERFSLKLREEEYRRRPNMPMTIRSVLGPPLAPSEVGPAQDPPASRQFFVDDAGQDKDVTINATLRAFTANVEYYEDAGEVGVPGDLGVMTDGTRATDQEITDLLAYYDTYGKPVIDEVFGGLGPVGTTNNFKGGLRPANDIDQNDGRFIVLQLRESRMSEDVAGYVSSCDRYPRQENYNAGGYYCSGSNEAEMTYLSHPDHEFYRGTLVHEVKHISSHGYAVLGGRDFNPSWLEEGTAEIAKEKSSRDAAGLADGMRVSFSDIYPGGSSTPETYGMVVVNSRARRFLKASPLSALIGDPEPNPEESSYYGASWLFHRFLADAYGNGDEDSFFLALNTGGSDVAQVEAVTGRPIETLFAEFLVAIGVEGQPAARATTTRRLESYDFHGIAAGWPSDPPWPYLQATSGFTTGTFSFSTHYTSPNFFDFTTAGGMALRLDAFSSGGSELNPGADVVLGVTRIR